MGEEVSELQESRDDEARVAEGCCPIIGTVLGLFGAVGGGVLGYFLFMWIARQGFYAVALPGALVGIGCGALSGRKSTGLGIVCGILGLAAGLLSERWIALPEGTSFGDLLRHLQNSGPVTLVLIAVGTICAFWFGRDREGGAWLRKRAR